MKPWLWLTLGVVLIVALGLATLPRPRGPTYQGRTVYSWLADYGHNPIGGGLVHARFAENRRRGMGNARNPPTNAIVALGTNAIGPLLREIQRPDAPGWLDAAKRWLSRRAWVKWGFRDVRSEREQAALAFFDLGTNALPALPELATLLTNYSSACLAAHALAGMGTNAIPVFATALTNSNSWVNDCGVWGLAQIGPAASNSVPEILPLLQKGNSADVMITLWALGEIAQPADVIRSELVQRLTHADTSVRNSAAQALTKLRDDAKPALAAIRAALAQEPDANVRQALEKLVEQLDGSPARATTN